MSIEEAVACVVSIVGVVMSGIASGAQRAGKAQPERSLPLCCSKWYPVSQIVLRAGHVFGVFAEGLSATH